MYAIKASDAQYVRASDGTWYITTKKAFRQQCPSGISTNVNIIEVDMTAIESQNQEKQIQTPKSRNILTVVTRWWRE